MANLGSEHAFSFDELSVSAHPMHDRLVELRKEAILNSRKLYEDFLKKHKGISDQLNYTSIAETVMEFSTYWERNKDKIYIEIRKDSVEKLKKKLEFQVREYTDFETKIIDMVSHYSSLENNNDELLSCKILSESFLATITKFKKFRNRRKRIQQTLLLIDAILAAYGMHTNALKGKKFKEKNVMLYTSKLAGYNTIVEKYVQRFCDSYRGKLPGIYAYIEEFEMEKQKMRQSFSELPDDMNNLSERTKKDLTSIIDSFKNCDTKITENLLKYKLFLDELKDERGYFKTIKKITVDGSDLLVVLKPFEYGLAVAELKELGQQLGQNSEKIEAYTEHTQFFTSLQLENKQFFDSKLKVPLSELTKDIFSKVLERVNNLKKVYKTELDVSNFAKNIEIVASKLSLIKHLLSDIEFTVNDFELSRETADSIISDFNLTTTTIMKLREDFALIINAEHICTPELKKLLNINIALNKEVRPLVWRLREAEQAKARNDINDEFIRHMEDWISTLGQKMQLIDKSITSNKNDEMYIEAKASAQNFKGELLAIHKILTDNAKIFMTESEEEKKSQNNLYKQNTIKLYGLYEDIKQIAHEFFLKIKLMKCKKKFQREADIINIKIEFYMKRIEKIYTSDINMLIPVLESHIEVIKNHNLQDKFIKLQRIVENFEEHPDELKWAETRIDSLKSEMKRVHEKIVELDEYLSTFKIYQESCVRLLAEKFYFESLRKLLLHQPIGSTELSCEKYIDMLKEIQNQSLRKFIECKNLIKNESSILKNSKYFPARYFKQIMVEEYEKLNRTLKMNENLLTKALKVHKWNKAAKEHCFILKELKNYSAEYRTTHKPIHYIDFLQRIPDLKYTLEELEKISHRLISESEKLEYPYSDEDMIPGTIVELKGVTSNRKSSVTSAKDLFIKIENIENNRILVTDGCELYIIDSKNMCETENSEISANDLMCKFPGSKVVKQRIIKFTYITEQVNLLLVMDEEALTQKRVDMDIISKLKYLKYWIKEKNGFLLDVRVNIKDIDDYSLDEFSKLQFQIVEHQHFLKVNKKLFQTIAEEKINILHEGLEKLLELLQVVRNELDAKATLYLLKNEFLHLEFRYKDIYINCIGIKSILKNSTTFKPLQTKYERETFNYNALKIREKIALNRGNNFDQLEKEFFISYVAKLDRIKLLIEKLFAELEKMFQDVIIYGKQNIQLEYIERKIDSEKLAMSTKDECTSLLEVQALLVQVENFTEAEYKGIKSEIERCSSEVKTHIFEMKYLGELLVKKIDELFLNYTKLLSLKDDKELYLKQMSLLFRYFNDIESFKYWQSTKISFCANLIDKKLKIDKESIGRMMKGNNIQSNKLDGLDATRKQLVTYFKDREEEINNYFNEALLLFNQLKYILENNFTQERTEYCLEDVFEEIEDLYAWFEEKYSKIKEPPSSNVDNIYHLIRNHRILKTEYNAKKEQLVSIAKMAENIDATSNVSETLRSYKMLLELSEKLIERIQVYDIHYGLYSIYYEIVKQLAIINHRMIDMADKLSVLELCEDKAELYKGIILMETFVEDLREIRTKMSNLHNKADTLTIEKEMKEDLMDKFKESIRSLNIIETTTADYEQVIDTYKVISDQLGKVDCHNQWLNEKLVVLDNLCNNVDIRLLDNMIMNLTNIEKEFMLHRPVLKEDVNNLDKFNTKKEWINEHKILGDLYSQFETPKNKLKKNLKKFKKLLKKKHDEIDAYKTLKNSFQILSENYTWLSQAYNRFENKNISLQTKEYVENEKKAFPEFQDQLSHHIVTFDKVSEDIKSNKVQNNKVDKLLVLTTNHKNMLLTCTENFMIRCDERIGILKIISEINALSAWLMDVERSLDIKYKELDEENILKAYEKLLQVKKTFDAFDRNEYQKVKDTFLEEEFLKDAGSVIEKKESLDKRWSNFSDDLNNLLNKLAQLNEGRYNIKSLLIAFANEASDFGETYDRVTEALAVSVKQRLFEEFNKIQEEIDAVIPSPQELNKRLDSLQNLNDTIQLKVGENENPYTFDTIDSITEMHKALDTQIKTYRNEVKAERKIHERRSKLCQKHIKIVEKIDENLSNIKTTLTTIEGSINKKMSAIVQLEKLLTHNGKLEKKMLTLQRKLAEIGVYSNPLLIDDPSALIKESGHLSKTLDERKYCLSLQLALEKLVASLSSKECEALSESFLNMKEKKKDNVEISDLDEILKYSKVNFNINTEKMMKILSSIGINSDSTLTHECFVLIVSHLELKLHETYIEDFKTLVQNSSQNCISEYELYQGLGPELAEFCVDNMKPAEDADDPFNTAYDIEEFCRRFFL